MMRTKRAPSTKSRPIIGRLEPARASEKEPSTLQTLDRGLQALEIISRHEQGIAVAELAELLAVHRTIAYRLVTTLESHGLIARDRSGLAVLAVGLLTMALRFEPHLRLLARPLLLELSEKTRATAFISAAQGNDCVAIVVVEPEAGLLRVAYRVGSRHPLALGAAGIAILAARPPRRNDGDAVICARRDGFSVTRSQLQRGAVGVASSLNRSTRVSAGFEASIGVVAFEDLDVTTATRAVLAAAQELSSLIG